MNSTKCPHCGLTNWATDAACKRCKQQLYPAEPASSFQAAAGNWQPETRYQPLKTGLAIASMVLGILSIPTSLFLIGLLLAPIGFILGIAGVVKANRHPQVFGGKGFAVAGIVTSACSFLLIVPIIAAIAIPNLLAARRAANEGSALSSLATIYRAEQTYMASTGRGQCADLALLAQASLIKAQLAGGENNGYRFSVRRMTDDETQCEVHAVPSSPSSGSRSFMISTYDGVIRWAKRNGGFAAAYDQPLSEDTTVIKRPATFEH